MDIRTYRCDDCKEQFEHTIDPEAASKPHEATPVTCPKCHGINCTRLHQFWIDFESWGVLGANQNEAEASTLERIFAVSSFNAENRGSAV